MSTLTLHFWQGRDNTELLALQENRQTIADLSGITRVRLEIIDSDTAFDSTTLPDLFEFPVDLTGADTGKQAIRLKLGDSGLAQGRYNTRLITFDADHPDGYAWQPYLTVVMG